MHERLLLKVLRIHVTVCSLFPSVSGGRDQAGRPILSLTQPDQDGLQELIEITEQELVDMLAYFTSVPRYSARNLTPQKCQL